MELNLRNFVMRERLTSAFERMMLEYRALGTVTLDELRQAIFTDFECLKDEHNVRYVKEAVVRFAVTDEYGQSRTVKRKDGSKLQRMETNYHRPVCKDFEL
mgnify:CR=1 FL=1